MTWFVLLTFLVNGHVREKTVTCPTWECVEEIRAHLRPPLARLQVWQSGDYARPAGIGMIWPPCLDETPI